jgi:hypothetical protein
MSRILFPDIVVNIGGFEYQHEREIAPLVAAFEGKSITPLRRGEAGVDGLLHYGSTPATLIGSNGLESVQFKDFSTGNAKNIVDRARDVKQDIVEANLHRPANEQLQNVSVFGRVNSSKVTVNSLVEQLKLDANSEHGGLVGITKGNLVSKATFFLHDGIVRVQGGNIFSCGSNGKCTQR